MEVIKSLLSEKADYLNALRHAQELPVISPPPVPQVPKLEVKIQDTISLTTPPTSKGYGKMLLVIGGIIVLIALVRYRIKKDNERKKSTENKTT